MALAAHSSPRGEERALDAGRRGRATAAPRGRHATPRGQGYGYLVGWTIAGTLLPGVGLVAAGRKIVGWLLVTVCFAAAAAAAVFVVTKDSPVDAALSLLGAAVDPTTLLYIAIGVGVVGLVWVAVIVATHVSLRRQSVLSRGQKTASSLLVVALVGLVAAPVAYASDLALVQRDLIQQVFGGTNPDPKPIGEGPQAQEEDPWASLPRVNVLLIGSDAGADRTGVRTDSLILASIDTQTGDTVMFSLPRNLEHAQFPPGTDGYEAWGDEGFYCVNPTNPNDRCFINAVWRWAAENQDGWYSDSAIPGPQAVMDAVSGTLGLRVDQYAVVDLRGFQKVVNAMGGITIDVKKRTPIGGGTNESTGRQNRITGYIEPGVQQLDGYHALWYARSRAESTDYDRMGRQRCVIGAIIDKADPLTLVKAYPALAAAAKEDISTDIQQADLEAWVQLTLRVKDGTVRSLPFDDTVVSDRANPDFDTIQNLVQDALLPPQPTTPTTDPTTPSVDPTTPDSEPTPGATATEPPVDPEQAQDLSAVC